MVREKETPIEPTTTTTETNTIEGLGVGAATTDALISRRNIPPAEPFIINTPPHSGWRTSVSNKFLVQHKFAERPLISTLYTRSS